MNETRGNDWWTAIGIRDVSSIREQPTGSGMRLGGMGGFRVLRGMIEWGRVFIECVAQHSQWIFFFGDAPSVGFPNVSRFAGDVGAERFDGDDEVDNAEPTHTNT